MREHVEIADDHEREIWARTFHVSPEELVELVRKVGPSPQKIRDVLKRAEIARVGGRRG